jgi:hypothetical protein
MSEPKHDPLPDAPFGTQPRRSPWPIYFWIIVFALWFALLVWMALTYPARGV